MLRAGTGCGFFRPRNGQRRYCCRAAHCGRKLRRPTSCSRSAKRVESRFPNRACPLARRVVAHTLSAGAANDRTWPLSAWQSHPALDRIAKHQFGDRHLLRELFVGQSSPAEGRPCEFGLLRPTGNTHFKTTAMTTCASLSSR